MLASHASRGAFFLIGANIFSRVIAIFAQLVTGLILTENDFGIYAAAIGIQSMAAITNGGRTQQYLLSLTPATAKRRAGTIWVVSTVLFLLGVIPALALAPWLAEWLDIPQLVPLLWILSGSTLLNPAKATLRALLNIDLKFGRAASADLIGVTTVYTLTIVLAILLRNPLALAIPIFAAHVLETGVLLYWVRPKRQDFRIRLDLFAPLLYRIRWLIGLAIFTALWMQGDFFVAEFLVTPAVLGVYYFAYQLAVQPGRFLNVSLMNVLVPIIRRAGTDSNNLKRSLARLLATGSIAIAGMNFALFAGVGPLERLLWNSKWAAAVLPVQVLLAGLTVSALLGVCASVLLAGQRYKDALVCEGLKAFGVISGAVIGGLVVGSAFSLAVSVSLGLALASVLGLVYLVRRLDGTLTSLIQALMVGPLLGLILAMGANLAGMSAMDLLDGRSGGALGFSVAAIVYLIEWLIALRLLPPSLRDDFLQLVPARIRQLLWMPSPVSQSE
jgi:O-antigen/teichoic acid export membrane protein